MNKKEWLCFNCVHSGNCHLETHATSPVLQCEEYAIKGSDEKPFLANTLQTETTSHLGLCISCDLKDDCSIRANNQIIINCEHYQ